MRGRRTHLLEEFHLDVSLCFRVVEEGGVVIRRRNDHAADSGFGQMDAFVSTAPLYNFDVCKDFLLLCINNFHLSSSWVFSIHGGGDH